MYAVRGQVRLNEGTATITTERLLIRSVQPEDFTDCEELYGDPYVTRFYDHGRPLTPNEVGALFEKSFRYAKQKVPLGLFSVFSRARHKFLGQVDLFPTSERQTLEIGCIIRADQQLSAFGLEAAASLVHVYVPHLNAQLYPCPLFPIKRVIATAHPDNHASCKMCERTGMILVQMKQRFGQPRRWYVIDYPVQSDSSLKLNFEASHET